jgi:hypothetical protein
MSSTLLQSIPISCRIHRLTVFTSQAEDETANTVLYQNEPFSVQVSLDFVGTNAIALLALKPVIQLDFYAKLLSKGLSIELGSLTTETNTQQLTYIPTLALGSPVDIGLTAAKVYRFGVLARIGALEQPALLWGIFEELMVQIHLGHTTSNLKT